jgi:hypothetical protein
MVIPIIIINFITINGNLIYYLFIYLVEYRVEYIVEVVEGVREERLEVEGKVEEAEKIKNKIRIIIKTKSNPPLPFLPPPDFTIMAT